MRPRRSPNQLLLYCDVACHVPQTAHRPPAAGAGGCDYCSNGAPSPAITPGWHSLWTPGMGGRSANTQTGCAPTRPLSRPPAAATIYLYGRLSHCKRASSSGSPASSKPLERAQSRAVLSFGSRPSWIAAAAMARAKTATSETRSAMVAPSRGRRPSRPRLTKPARTFHPHRRRGPQCRAGRRCNPGPLRWWRRLSASRKRPRRSDRTAATSWPDGARRNP